MVFLIICRERERKWSRAGSWDMNIQFRQLQDVLLGEEEVTLNCCERSCFCVILYSVFGVTDLYLIYSVLFC